MSLLAAMLGTDEVVLGHEESGKPTLDGWYVSISHTKGYAAALLSRKHEVGIDIEYTSDRVSRIASRFLRADEQPQTVAEQLVYWSAKETMYKLYSEDKLEFQQMRLSGYSAERQIVVGENLKRNERTSISALVTDGYTLTYAFL